MSVENPENAAEAQIDGKPLNGKGEVNGIRNGHVEKKEHSSSRHKSSNKDKHRDRDRADYKSSKSSHRDKDYDKHKSSSSNKDKARDKDRKDRDKDKERSKDKDRDKEKHHKSSSSSHKSSRDKDKERNREKDKERSKDKDKERDYEKEKDRKKEHKSSNDKDRHKTSSSNTKHSNSSSSKDKHRDKDRLHSSSSKDKDRHRGKDKHRSDKSSSSFILNGNSVVDGPKPIVEKPRNDYDQSCTGFDSKDNEFKTPLKEEYSFNNVSQASSCDYSMSQFRKDEPDFSLKSEPLDDENQELTIDEDAENESKHEINVKVEVDDNDVENIPLAKRKYVATGECDSEDDIPLISRKKIKSEKKDKSEKKKKRKIKDEDLEDEYTEVVKPKKKKIKNEKSQVNESITTTSPTKKKKKDAEEEQEVWRWWEEEKKQDGVKWNFLEHKGPVFAPLYESLPKNIRFFYDGKEIRLSEDAEEAATFYAKMLNHDYVTKKQFNDNFFKDWRKTMTSREKDTIKDLSKCNFNEMHQFFTAQSEQRKNSTKEEKLVIKKQNEDLIKEYGFCTIDGHKEKIGNFKLEPPGLFRGRGEHPKMGMIKRRIMPEDVSINCAKNSKIPQPPKGHKWKEVRHDNTVTWLASWIENVQGQGKYIMLNPSSKLKGEKDFMKYETARRLDKHIEKIRATYRDEWKSKEMRVRQRAVALYFIDKLALRAGNEKDEDQADTVGCCSLRVEHVSLHKEMNGKENVVVFDFLGKDSIRYYNEVEVEKRVFKNLELFMDNKKEGDDLFDRLNTQVLNEHLKELMDGLTAKVFRTYNASITLQNQLDLLTDANATVPEKLLAYNRANRAVAVLCNHQRSVPKSHDKSMENLKEKIRQKREAIDDCESELYDLRKAAKRGSAREKILCDKKQKQFDRLKEQLKKLELQETDRDENKTIALGTSKLNYLDPRISVAWCKKYNVPIEKIFNKTHRDKFRWAIHMADENYRF